MSNGKRRYWAGGAVWGSGPTAIDKKSEFIRGNFWQMGWGRDDPRARRYWTKLDQIQVGDMFAIKGFTRRGQKIRFYYVGTVTAVDTQTSRVDLAPVDTPPFSGPSSGGPGSGAWGSTLIEVTKPADIARMYGQADGNRENDDISVDVDEGDAIVGVENDTRLANELIEGPLNLILYGPPGTGKTYSVVDRAVEIIDGTPPIAAHKRAKLRFDRLCEAGRIQFTTFHQSYTYEDFVEGIRPVLDDESLGSNGNARYKIVDGIFKSMALRALAASLDKTAPATPAFRDIWQALLDKVESNPDFEIHGFTSRSVFRLEVSDRENLVGINIASKQSPQPRYLASRRNVEEIYNHFRDRDSIVPGDIRPALNRGSHENLEAPVFNELKRILGSGLPRTPSDTSTPDAVDAQAYLASRGKSDYRVVDAPPKYVLIIDEINRGNISKIFGELITLLEADKRINGDNELIVTLPFTQEPFGVPSNLYVLGTMNTADKSIALIDVALRRRFQFEEMRPDFGTCEPKLSTEMRNVLEELNRRIEFIKDRDHLIGHAYFMDIKSDADFNGVMRKQIVPLLQEYFYNDWQGLRDVLGESSAGGSGLIRELKHSGLPKRQGRYQWWFDAAPNEELDILQQLRKNYGPASAAQADGS